MKKSILYVVKSLQSMIEESCFPRWLKKVFSLWTSVWIIRASKALYVADAADYKSLRSSFKKHNVLVKVSLCQSGLLPLLVTYLDLKLDPLKQEKLSDLLYTLHSSCAVTLPPTVTTYVYNAGLCWTHINFVYYFDIAVFPPGMTNSM